MEAQERIITKVEAEPRRPGRYRVEVDGERTLSVHEDVVVKFRLVKGARLSAETERAVLEEEERQMAYRCAIRYIGRAMRSAGEVRDKLAAKGYAPELVRHVLERLRDQGYVDDAAYAHALAAQRLRQNRKGRLWIRHELARKGVGKEEAERALAALDPEDEREQAWQLAARRWDGLKGEPADKLRKVYRLLLRRGFPAEVARSVALRLKERHADAHADREAFGDAGCDEAADWEE